MQARTVRRLRRGRPICRPARMSAIRQTGISNCRAGRVRFLSMQRFGNWAARVSRTWWNAAAGIVLNSGGLPGARALNVPVLNQGLVRFEREGASDAENDAFTDEVIRRTNATGEAFFSGTTWNGVRAMRVSVVSWRTGEDDVSRSIAAVARVLSEAGAAA